MQGGRRGSWQQPQPQSQVGAAVGSAAALSASATSSQSLLLWALQTPGATQTGVDWPGLGDSPGAHCGGALVCPREVTKKMVSVTSHSKMTPPYHCQDMKSRGTDIHKGIVSRWQESLSGRIHGSFVVPPRSDLAQGVIFSLATLAEHIAPTLLNVIHSRMRTTALRMLGEQAVLLSEEEYLIWSMLGNKPVFEGQRLTGVT
ncbi:hypothetical protein LEMLEM_LOCUS12790 [Lemmus lemmus]